MRMTRDAAAAAAAPCRPISSGNDTRMFRRRDKDILCGGGKEKPPPGKGAWLGMCIIDFSSPWDDHQPGRLCKCCVVSGVDKEKVRLITQVVGGDFQRFPHHPPAAAVR